MNAQPRSDMTTHLGIEFIEVGENYLVARMPVDERTRQPMGLLHGGASVVLAETLGSMAGYLMLPEGKVCVGLEINANHIRSVREGYVYGKATPLHIGKNTHVWDIKIHDQQNRLVCISRLTLAVIQAED
ncbi:MAG: hotdog fold thioesterase [Cytophagales bacterium]|nr:hotdog fold thioesterase [Bernardetiaceae bacterium]MDW8205742.1 hotdog fold thioesterase [Cytophagales bacterium]